MWRPSGVVKFSPLGTLSDMRHSSPASASQNGQVKKILRTADYGDAAVYEQLDQNSDEKGITQYANDHCAKGE